MASIRLPVTQRLRALLASNGKGPSSKSETTYQDLYRVLQQRKGDPDFWSPLSELLRELIEGAVHGKAAAWQRVPQLKLLATWDVDELSKLLREALPQWPEVGDDTGLTLRERSVGTLDTQTAVLSAFLLLGLGVGCSSSSSPSGVSAHDSGVGSTGGSSGLHLADAGTGGSFVCPYPKSDAGNVAVSDAGMPSACTSASAAALWTIIDDACLTSQDKQAIYAEFSDLKASWCDGLVELFKTENAAQIASQLETLIMCGGSAMQSDYSTSAQQRLVQGMCNSVILYKGVSFPEPEEAQTVAADTGSRDA